MVVVSDFEAYYSETVSVVGESVSVGSGPVLGVDRRTAGAVEGIVAVE